MPSMEDRRFVRFAISAAALEVAPLFEKVEAAAVVRAVIRGRRSGVGIGAAGGGRRVIELRRWRFHDVLGCCLRDKPLTHAVVPKTQQS
jgi:hypothetical protein